MIVFFVLFKSVGGLIHLPFIGQFTRLVQWIVPDDKENVLGIDNIDKKLDSFTSYTILQIDIKKFVDQALQLNKQRTEQPDKYDEDQYLKQKANYDKIFRFLIIFPFYKLGFTKGEEMYPISALQEAMQGTDTIVSARASLKLIASSKDTITQTYRIQIVAFCEEIYKLIEENEFSIAKEKLQFLKDWDEKEIAAIIENGKEISSDLAVLFQVHDKIHGSLACLLKSKKYLLKFAQ